MGFLESWVCGELQLYYKKPYLLTFLAKVLMKAMIFQIEGEDLCPKA